MVGAIVYFVSCLKWIVVLSLFERANQICGVFWQNRSRFEMLMLPLVPRGAPTKKNVIYLTAYLPTAYKTLLKILV